MLGTTDFGYTGQRNLAGTGLMDYNARLYAPGLGRWTQPDTIVPGAGNPQAWNRFAYVLNSPVNLIDPTGHVPGESQKCFGKDGFGQKCGGPLLDGMFSAEVIRKDPIFLLQSGVQTNRDRQNYEQGNIKKPGLAITTQNPSECLQKIACAEIVTRPANICYYCYLPPKGRSADYFDLNVGFSIPGLGAAVSIQLGLIIDRYGNFYGYAGGTVGPDAVVGISGSAMAGHITHQGAILGGGVGRGLAPSSDLSQSVLSGAFTNFAACVGVCFGGSIAQEVPYIAIQAGLGSPQISAGHGYSQFLFSLNTTLWRP